MASRRAAARESRWPWTSFAGNLKSRWRSRVRAARAMSVALTWSSIPDAPVSGSPRGGEQAVDFGNARDGKQRARKILERDGAGTAPSPTQPVEQHGKPRAVRASDAGAVDHDAVGARALENQDA